MSRKTIAVCVTGFDLECESEIVAGIRQRCLDLDINLLIFASLMRRPELDSPIKYPESVINGENSIFDLINYDMLDGIILIGETFLENTLIHKLSKRAAEHGVPVVNVNDPANETDYNVVLNDETAMDIVMRHLVCEHGFTKINFIGGFPGNLQTEERLSAYKKVLAENNIEIDENRIGYGHFWKDAYKVTEEFISSGDIPQAIVCANDTMAFFCMDCLMEHGLSVPGDVAVTGFDGVADCQESEPTLTSVRRAFLSSGVRAVDLLCELFDGKPVEKYSYVGSALVINQSCGCVPVSIKTKKAFIDSRYGELNRYKEFDTILNYLNTVFESSETSEQFYDELKRGAQYFKIKRMFVCVSSDAEKYSVGFENIETPYSQNGVSNVMLSMLRYGHDISDGSAFFARYLLPFDFLNEEKSVCIAFSPMHFKDRVLGYIAYDVPYVGGLGELFTRWVRSISANAGCLYMNKELQTAVGKLENLYIRDHLTGLYNRRGMEKLGNILIERARQNNMFISVICADIDNLKTINDSFGHEGGDNAIVKVADAIRFASDKNSVSSRTGGDEFCIILAHKERSDVEVHVARIAEYLNSYNETSGLEYKVDCSCGYYTAQVSRLVSIDSMTKLADNNMYEVKFRKKQKK
ncbi:MAG: GGDEF domain-containing protein [Oscillospiraceae bacterium]